MRSTTCRHRLVLGALILLGILGVPGISTSPATAADSAAITASDASFSFSAADRSITLTLRIQAAAGFGNSGTDGESAASFFGWGCFDSDSNWLAYMTSFLTNENRISGDAFDGVYATTASLPWWPPDRAVTCNPAAAALVDNAGRSRTWQVADLQQDGLYFPFEVPLPIIMSDGSFSFSQEDFTATLTVRVQAAAGFGNVGWYGSFQWSCSGPLGPGPQMWMSIRGEHRISGDGSDGVYRVTAPVPHWTGGGGGTCTPSSAYLHDDGWGFRSWTASDLQEEGLYFPFDVQYPLLEASDGSFSFSQHDRTATLTLRIQASGGFGGSDTSFFAWDCGDDPDPYKGAHVEVHISGENRISGDAYDGVYSVTAPIPEWEADGGMGTCTPASAILDDDAGRSAYYWRIELEDAGLYFPFTVGSASAGISFQGAFEYDLSGAVLVGLPAVQRDRFGIASVEAALELPSASGNGTASLVIRAKRLWIWPTYFGWVAVDDPGMGFSNRTPIAFGKVTSPTPDTVAGTSRWLSTKRLPWTPITLNWTLAVPTP